jgi:hypothetical protein
MQKDQANPSIDTQDHLVATVKDEAILGKLMGLIFPA